LPQEKTNISYVSKSLNMLTSKIEKSGLLQQLLIKITLVQGWDSDPQHAGDIANSSYYTRFLSIFLEVKQTKNISVASE